MKKAVAALLAVVCAAATAVEAGAYDITHCRAEWDPVTDYIFYRDLDTDEIVAVEHPDGSITDYYPEAYETAEEEPEPTYEETVPDPVITDPWAWMDPQPTEDADTEEAPSTEDEWWFDSEEEYADPYIVDITAKDTSLKITAAVSSAVKFDSWALYNADWWADDELIAEGTKRFDYSATEWGIDISLTKLIPGEEYNYRLVLYKDSEWGRDSVGRVEFYAKTELPMFETRMLTPAARQNSIAFMAVIDSRKEADGFIVQKYSGGKWVTVEKNGILDRYHVGSEYYYDYDNGVSYDFSLGENEDQMYNYDLRSASYTASDLKSMTQYKYRIRFFKKTGKNKRKYLDTVTATATTLMAAPELDLGATAKKAKLSWDKVKGADGYEVYVNVSDDTGSSSDRYYYYDGWYYDNGTSWFNEKDYKKLKTIKGGSKTSASYDIKGSKVYTYCVRAYKGSGKKKIYSEYSQAVATNSTEAILNGLTLKQKSTGLGEYDLGLVKSALKQCVNDKMSNYEKARAVYDYVHNVAQYEYDISKVSLDSIKAILSDHAGQCYQYAVTYQAMMKYLGFDMKLIGGKTASGGPHWWNEMVINGAPRMFDPQVGGRFCILYEQLGSRMVTKEKTVE